MLSIHKMKIIGRRTTTTPIKAHCRRLFYKRMEKEKNIEIHETAFVTSTFRSFNEALSQDPFAKLWNNHKTEQWVEDYLEQVSSEETLTHCLRNRYFLDQIKKLVATNKIEVLINFGCGFSMYPFLLDENLVNIEIDKPETMDYKEKKIKDWQKNNILPKRNIQFIGVDFSKDYQQGLLTKIRSIKQNKPCFILIEGVLFFLNRKDTDSLFSFFNDIQNQGDFVGSASFPEETINTLAFKKLLSFINTKVSKTGAEDYQTIPDEYYQTRPAYELIDHQDYFSLSKRYGNTVRLKKELILNENFYLLEKK